MHDPAAPANLPRRTFLLSAGSLFSLVLLKPAAALAGPAAPYDAFMTVSRLIAPRLESQTGQALYRALANNDPSFVFNVQVLAGVVRARPAFTIEILAQQLDRIHSQALRQTLNQIVSAWYLGIVGNRTYAYASALMYRPTADVLSPPSYVRAGPLNWATAQPPLNDS